MESWKCDVCDKSFSGIICFKQHEASEKHKKKIKLMNGVDFDSPSPVQPLYSPSQFHCSICKVFISGLDNYQKHVNSLEHAIMVQKKNNDCLSQYVSSTFELKTEKNHTQSAVALTGPTNAVTVFAECKPCQKQFSGPEPYQQHLVSAGHKKKCGPLAQIIQIDATDSVASKNYSSGNVPCDHESPVSVSSYTEPVKAIASFAECKPCCKQFSGPEPYQQHLASAGHQKKCGPLSQVIQIDELSDSHKKTASEKILENSISENQSVFKCNICIMVFTGPKPYKQHLESIGHAKKIRTAGLSQQSAATESVSPDDSTFKNNNIVHEQSHFNDCKYYCDTCKIQCSGPIPYSTHLSGREHSKNLRILLVEENMRKIKVSGPFPYVEYNGDSTLSNEVSSTADLYSGSESEVIEITPSGSKINDLNINIKEETKKFSDKFQITMTDLSALPILNIIPPEKLDVAVIQSDDEIVFSSPRKCR